MRVAGFEGISASTLNETERTSLEDTHATSKPAAFPGRGFPLRLSRTYRSKRDFESSVLGFNWHLGYDEYLTPGGFVDASSVPHSAVEWTMDDGKRDRWVDWDGNGYYQPFNGFFGKIRWLGSGLGWQIRYPDGTVTTF